MFTAYIRAFSEFSSFLTFDWYSRKSMLVSFLTGSYLIEG